jgi:hypothetical protein
MGEEDTEITAPACPAATDWFKTVQLQDSSNIAYKYFDEILNKGGGKRWVDFRRPDNTIQASEFSEYFLDVLKALNPGYNVLALPKSGPLKVPQYPKTNATAARPVTAVVPGSVRPIFALQSAPGSCGEPHDPYDLASLLDALRANYGTAPTEVRILVADSGLFGVGHGPFSRDLLVSTEKLNDLEFAVSPMLGGRPEEIRHGTQVASLALGGPSFARFNALGGFIKLRPVRIYGLQTIGDRAIYGPLPDYFSVIMREASRWDVNIINLSLKSPSEIDEMKKSDNSHILFIVAAGNDEGLAPDDSRKLGTAKTTFYPAMYGPGSRWLGRREAVVLAQGIDLAAF